MDILFLLLNICILFTRLHLQSKGKEYPNFKLIVSFFTKVYEKEVFFLVNCNCKEKQIPGRCRPETRT